MTYIVEVWDISKVSCSRNYVPDVSITTANTIMNVSLQAGIDYTMSVTAVNSQGLTSRPSYPSDYLEIPNSGNLVIRAELNIP